MTKYLLHDFFPVIDVIVIYATRRHVVCFEEFPLPSVSFVKPGVVSGLFQTSAKMPFEAYIVM
jgi:hypothetical protein